MNRQILLIGIGQFGCAVADSFARTYRPEDGPVRILAIDSDARTEDRITAAPYLSMASRCRIADVIDEADTDLLKQWFPCDRENECVEYFETMSMNEGANQWRMKGLLAFYHFLSKPKNRELLFESFFDGTKGEELPSSVEIVPVASLSGGTGSALFLPLTLYLKKLFRERGIKDVTAKACLALPDLCEDTMTGEQKIKARANAYAALRELNAISRNALGAEEPFSFRIGCEEDPRFGLLYDAENPEFKTESALPFRNVFLFRRIPGISSTAGQIMFLTDALRSLCNEEPQPLLTTDGIYGGISLTKAIFPARDLVSYIAESDFCRTAKDQWFHLYNTAKKELRQVEKDLSRKSGTEEVPKGSRIGQSVLNGVRILCPDDKDGFAALLNRSYPHPETDPTPTDLIPDEFLRATEDGAAEFFACDAEAAIRDFLEENTATEDENGKPIKRKNPLFGRQKRREETLEQMAEQVEYLQKVYDCSRGKIAKMKEWNPFRFPEEISLTDLVLKDDNGYLHPAFVLARLSALREELSSSIRIASKNLTAARRNWQEGPLPTWLVQAEITVRTKSRYSKDGITRFMKVLADDVSHVGDKYEDLSLFCYDLQTSLTRMKNALYTMYKEEIILRLERWIEAYDNLFRITEKQIREKAEDLESAEQTPKARTPVYRISDTKEEKKALYLRYCKATGADASCSPRAERLDRALGKGFEEILLKTNLCTEDPDAQTDPERAVEDLLHTLESRVREECEEEDFCREILSRNVLKAILSCDGKNGGDSAELAVSKAFSSGLEPLLFHIPDAQSSAPLSSMVHRSVRALLPTEAKDFLEEIRQNYGNADPRKILDKFLFSAGEYEAEASFTESLPHGELRMLRKTEGLKLHYLEEFSETSDSPTGYKAYRKALAMEWEQTTALWNPHLICGMGEDSLPPIAKP